MNDDSLIVTERRRRQMFGGRGWIVLAALLIATVLFIVFNRPAPEPMFEGQPLSAHLTQLAGTASSKEYQTAAEAVAHAGTNALPVLLQTIQKPEPWYIALYFQHWTNLPVWPERRLRDQLDPWSHRNRVLGAIRAVGLLGTNAAPIAHELVAELPRLQNSSRTPLSESLVQIGPAVVEPIMPLLTSTNMRTRSLAAYVCYMLGPKSVAAAPALVNGLLDGNANHQNLVGHTLVRMGRDAHPVVLELLSGTNKIMITAGLRAAEGASLQPSELIEKILRHLDDSDPDIHRAAALLISKKWPVNSTQVERNLRPRAPENERIADYLKSIQMIEQHRKQLHAILREGAFDPGIIIQLKFIGELVRHKLIDDELIALLDQLSEQNTEPVIRQTLDYRRGQITEFLNARTNSHPDTVRASQSAP